MAGLAEDLGEKGGVPEGPDSHLGGLGCDLITDSIPLPHGFLLSP